MHMMSGSSSRGISSSMILLWQYCCVDFCGSDRFGLGLTFVLFPLFVQGQNASSLRAFAHISKSVDYSITLAVIELLNILKIC